MILNLCPIVTININFYLKHGLEIQQDAHTSAVRYAWRPGDQVEAHEWHQGLDRNWLLPVTGGTVYYIKINCTERVNDFVCIEMYGRIILR
jgi:hypothetical protein